MKNATDCGLNEKLNTLLFELEYYAKNELNITSEVVEKLGIGGLETEKNNKSNVKFSRC